MRIILAIALLSLTGCTAIKTKQHVLFCVGACIHHEGEVQKEGGELPKKPAPEVASFKEP
jgi:hypothetical protein